MVRGMTVAMEIFFFSRERVVSLALAGETVQALYVDRSVHWVPGGLIHPQLWLVIFFQGD